MISFRNEKQVIDGMQELVQDAIEFLSMKSLDAKFKVEDEDRKLYSEATDIFRIGTLTQIATNTQNKRLMVTMPFVNPTMDLIYGYDDDRPSPMDKIFAELKRSQSKALSDMESSCLDTFFDLSVSLLRHYDRQYEYTKGDILKSISADLMGEEIKPNKIMDEKLNEHFLIWKPFTDKKNIENIGIEMIGSGVGFVNSKCAPIYKKLIDANEEESAYIDAWIKNLANFNQKLLLSGFDKSFLNIASMGFEEKIPMLISKPSKRIMR